jgi:hypothetical protein
VRAPRSRSKADSDAISRGGVENSSPARSAAKLSIQLTEAVSRSTAAKQATTPIRKTPTIRPLR